MQFASNKSLPNSFKLRFRKDEQKARSQNCAEQQVLVNCPGLTSNWAHLPAVPQMKLCFTASCSTYLPAVLTAGVGAALRTIAGGAYPPAMAYAGGP